MSLRDVRVRRCTLAALLWCLAAPANADGGWIVTAGGEIDDEEGYRADLGLAWLPSPATTVSAYAGRSDSSADFADFSTTSAGIDIDRSFGLFGASIGYSVWGDSDLLDTETLAASVYLHGERWRIALSGERRDSDFEAFDFNTVIPIRTQNGLVLVPVSGTATCGLDDDGYGLSFSTSGAKWTFSAGGMAYDYDDTDCDIDDVVLPPEIDTLPPISREIFRRIAARVLDATGRLIGTVLTRENGFLESTLSAGVTWTPDDVTWALDYFHDREEFLGLESDTLVGSVTLPVSERFDVELRAGATDTDLVGTVAFAGLTIYAYLGNPR